MTRSLMARMRPAPAEIAPIGARAAVHSALAAMLMLALPHSAHALDEACRPFVPADPIGEAKAREAPAALRHLWETTPRTLLERPRPPDCVALLTRNADEAEIAACRDELLAFFGRVSAYQACLAAEQKAALGDYNAAVHLFNCQAQRADAC